MDFRLTKEEALFQKMCRQFALNEVEPIAAEIDEQERYPEETVQKAMVRSDGHSVPEGSRRLGRHRHCTPSRSKR